MDVMGNVKRSVEAGDLVEGRYRIISILGEGGMGTVYLAEHTLIKRKVAIKILHAQFAEDATVVERFMNEARAAGTLGHPNIVESTDMGFTHDHIPYIVLEYLEGALLTDEIYRVGGLPVRRAVRIAEQIANALRAAHDAGIVHRDLKSDNIFLTDKDDASDHVKVLDFGISRFMERDDHERGLVMGTPEFMAPEQITQPDAVDQRADIYALGVILYEMLTARRPFTAGKDTQELQRKILHAAPPPLERDVPHGLSELIIDRLLAKDPGRRPQSMGAVQAALDAFLTRSDGTPIPRRRSQPIAAVSDEDIGRDSSTIPRPHGMLHTPYPAGKQPTGDAASRKRSYIAYAAGGLGVALGAIGLVIGLQGRRTETVVIPPPVVSPAPAPAIAMPQPAPAKPEVHKIAVKIDSEVSGARVVFRRRVSPAPLSSEITASDIVELVEVSAPGYKTERYWLTFDRDTHLEAHLVRGSGISEATEEDTLVALGELASPKPAPAPLAIAFKDPAPPKQAPAPRVEPAAAPAPAARPVEVAAAPAAPVMARRKIGREASEPQTETAPAAERANAGVVAMEPATPAPSPAAVPAQTTPAAASQPEPSWAKPDEAPAKPQPPTVIPPATLKTLLVSSSPIEPPEVVQAQMMRDDKKKASAVLKVCVGAGGEVTSAAIAKSSGYGEYDDRLVAGVRSWRYRPYMINGQYVPVCSAAAFAFTIQ